MRFTAKAVVAELASFLRKSNRPLRQASLSALDTILAAYAGSLRAADLIFHTLSCYN